MAYVTSHSIEFSRIAALSASGPFLAIHHHKIRNALSPEGRRSLVRGCFLEFRSAMGQSCRFRISCLCLLFNLAPIG